MAWLTETKAGVGALIIFGLVLLCGLLDSHNGSNDFGAGVSSVVNAVAAVATVVGLAFIVGLVFKHHFGKK